MKPIHVVHIIPQFGFGGAEKFVVELTKYVSGASVRQSVVTLWGHNQQLTQELPDTIVYRSINFEQKSKWSRMRDLRRTLRELKVDIVHTHLFGADVWGRIAAYTLGIPVVTTEHNTNFDEPRSWNYIKRVMRNFSIYYSAPSEAVGDYMEKTYRISRKKISIIPHGVELERFVSIPPARFLKQIQLGMVGRLVEQKGHTVAIDALKKLDDLPCKLHIVGEGPLDRQLHEYATQNGVAEKIEWHLPMLDIERLYASCDILLVPSRWEGLGLVILEAMASGRLVIASRVGGIPEIISSHKTGLLFPKEDSNALAELIRESVANKKKSYTIAKEARKWVTLHSDIRVMAEKYEEIYKNSILR